MKRKVCVITGSRAEYGLLYWVIKDIFDAPELDLQLVATCMHLSPEFGLTIRDIEKDGFPIAERVEMLLSSDTETAIAISMGIGVIGFAKVYERLRPDIIVVLGDRFELHAAVSAALPFRIPVAHIHGGESTEGAFDELIRHAITKMSHIHFTSTEEYRQRVIQMGELPENVFCTGAPGLDHIHKLKLMNKKELSGILGFPSDRKIGIVTYHPVTLEKNNSEKHISELLKAIQRFQDLFWIFTMPNADTSGRIIMRKIEGFLNKNPERGKVFISLGQVRYLSLMKHAVVMVGNSSSGIIEAPSFELPVVNIGERQRGRIRAQNVIDVSSCNEKALVAAINKAISTEFRHSLRGICNPYGEGHSSDKIVGKLKTIPLDEKLIKKRFHKVL